MLATLTPSGPPPGPVPVPAPAAPCAPSPDGALILAAFRVRSFRFQWSADLLTSWAFEMETLVLGWYVMVHTGSVLLLTAFGSLQYVGTLAAPMFGVLGRPAGRPDDALRDARDLCRPGRAPDVPWRWPAC